MRISKSVFLVDQQAQALVYRLSTSLAQAGHLTLSLSERRCLGRSCHAHQPAFFSFINLFKLREYTGDIVGRSCLGFRHQKIILNAELKMNLGSHLFGEVPGTPFLNHGS